MYHFIIDVCADLTPDQLASSFNQALSYEAVSWYQTVKAAEKHAQTLDLTDYAFVVSAMASGLIPELCDADVCPKDVIDRSAPITYQLIIQQAAVGLPVIHEDPKERRRLSVSTSPDTTLSTSAGSSGDDGLPPLNAPGRDGFKPKSPVPTNTLPLLSAAAVRAAAREAVNAVGLDQR